eukprot:COSAG01_NODE_53518_length_338_cov_2.920502_1_plen_58_part_10
MPSAGPDARSASIAQLQASTQLTSRRAAIAAADQARVDEQRAEQELADFDAALAAAGW